MDIRKLQESDFKSALDLVEAVFDEFEAPEYSKEGVAEFKKFIAIDSIMRMHQNGAIKFWGCYDGDNLVGIIATRNISHICLLFVNKEYHRRGIARELFNTMLNDIKDKDIKTITVNSSPYAKEVYHRFGFKDMKKEQLTNGIRYTPMSCILK